MPIALSQVFNRWTLRHHPQWAPPALLAAFLPPTLAMPLPGNAQPYSGGRDQDAYRDQVAPDERGAGRRDDSRLLVRCESTNQRYRHCRADTEGGVQLYRQFSKNACRYQKTWGHDRRGVWVDGGCRAEFAPQ